jgi:hypothetical protein
MKKQEKKCRNTLRFEKRKGNTKRHIINQRPERRIRKHPKTRFFSYFSFSYNNDECKCQRALVFLFHTAFCRLFSIINCQSDKISSIVSIVDAQELIFVLVKMT